MKTIIKFSIICLTAISFLTFTGCDKNEESDTTKPVIKLIEPEEDDVLKIGADVHFEAEFEDDKMLASYKVNIHPNFDGHSHAVTKGETETVDFEFEKSWTISGKNTSIHHHEIVIPENATPGHYHLMVYCTDAAGNESYIAVDIELSHEGEEHEHEEDEHND
ncbi:MAG: DUF4625 domain-containing protein [Prevotellaceae bacterium]|jgi:uncharacterized membrane protein|nr:DUF4625 domain-containing protein [Prevotellaceae bacterium]